MELEKKKSAKELIQNAVLFYMDQKALEKITVTEICKSVGISRSTFYLHYSDCFQVWETIQEEFCQQLKTILSRLQDGDDPESVMAIHQAMAELIKRNQQAYHILLHTHTESTAMKEVIACAMDLMRKNLRGRTGLDEKSLDLVLTFIVFGSIACEKHLGRDAFAGGESDRLLLDMINHGVRYFEQT